MPALRTVYLFAIRLAVIIELTVGKIIMADNLLHFSFKSSVYIFIIIPL